VANFGAFVDIGVHQDGLVHISALSSKFIDDPRKVVKAGDVVKVKVLEVDVARKRIALTMRLNDEVGASSRAGRSDMPARQESSATAVTRSYAAAGWRVSHGCGICQAQAALTYIYGSHQARPSRALLPVPCRGQLFAPVSPWVSIRMDASASLTVRPQQNSHETRIS
jgi:predicted RNA-binding protein with RPS1 domain